MDPMLFDYDSIPDFLTAELKRRSSVNSRYSLRAYARSLGLSAGELSEVLRLRRHLSLRSALKIAKAMGLNPSETKHLIHLIQVEKSRKLGATEQLDEKPLSLKTAQLDRGLFELISDWHHFAILNLIDCEGFQWNSQWIARRLGLTAIKAKLAMDLLMRLGLVRKEFGRVVGAKDFVFGPSDKPSEAVRNYHKQILEKAIESLQLQKISEREISGIGFAVNRKSIPAIKKEMTDFQDRILAKYSRGRRQEVYFLEMALFKLTQGTNDDN